MKTLKALLRALLSVVFILAIEAALGFTAWHMMQGRDWIPAALLISLALIVIVAALRDLFKSPNHNNRR